MRKVIPFTALTGLTLLISACGRYRFGCGDGWRPMMDFGCFGHGGMFMGMLLIVILVAAAIYWFARAAKTKMKSISGETPLDILKKRYAGGEITKDDFERIKKDLEA
jgi:putative membrane protein